MLQQRRLQQPSVNPSTATTENRPILQPSQPQQDSVPVPVATKPPQPVRNAEVSEMEQAGVISIPVGRVFLPAGFKIGAVGRKLQLFDRPDHLYKQLPRLKGRHQKFGRIELANGLQYRFILDMAPDDYRLFVDMNLNGNLEDDGEPLKNRGTGLFATTVSLPLEQATGLPGLKGEYQLWVYTNKSALRRDILNFYAKTQLSGQLRIGSRNYTFFLADNYPVDGDYCNDGVNIDVDGDGRIDHKTEHIAPGEVIELGGKAYRFEPKCS